MGVIMHNNIPYGGGSSIEPNPQESATEQLETLGIDGDVYEVTDANAAREVQATITEAQSRTNLADGDSVPTIFGKIKKWFSDLKDLAFIGKDGASSTKYLRGDGTWQNFPTIPTVNDATLTIQKNGTAVETFTANSSTNKTANITVPTKTSDLTNDSGFVTTDEKVTAELFNPSSGTLQYVPFLGSTNNQKPRVNDGIRYETKEGTTSANGYGRIYLGNGVQTGTAGNKKGTLIIYSEKNGYVDLKATGSSTTGRDIIFPDASGTVALTSNLSGYLPLSGGTLTGQLTFAQAGYKTYNVSGYAVDDAGNFAHTNSNAAHWFHLDNQAKTMSLKYYWETGKLYVPADIYANGDKKVITSPLYSTGSVSSGKTGVQKIAQITLSEVGTYYITGWAKFTGGGKKAVQLWCAGTLGESWEDSTIAVGEPKTFSTFAIYTSTVANEDVKVNSYTVSASNAVTGGLVAFKIA